MYKPILTIALLFLICTGYSQKILTTLDKYNKEFVPEKIHVHFDKNSYNAGETIWFKAYITEGILPTTISTNFFAELIDRTGKIVDQKIIPVFLSSAACSFDIPLGWKGDGLLFRAYTTWMLNFDSTLLYTKPIQILSSDSKQKSFSARTELKFLPEGGELVAGLESILAFKAANEFGYPVNISGNIKTSNGEPVQEFKTVHNGMGRLKFTPKTDTRYYAEWTENGETRTVELPQAKPSGLVLNVTENNEAIIVTVSRSKNAEELKAVHLVAQMHQQVVYKAKLNLDKKEKVQASIPRQALISGNLLVTVFDEYWQPVAERLKFVDREDYSFSADIKWLSKDLKKRGLNTFEIQIPDTLASNLSVSVTDALADVGATNDNIISKLLLTSDLRGYVYNPAYYFSNGSDSTKEHLDLVLLTNGWRRYDWKQLAAGIVPELKHKKDSYLNLSGTVLGVTPAQIPKGTVLNLILMKKDSTRQYINAPVNETGTFAVNKLVFFDTVQVFYQFNGKSYLNERASVEFNRKTLSIPALSKPDKSLLGIQPYSISDRNLLFASKAAQILPQLEKKAKGLDEIIIRTKARTREQELEKKYTSGLFQGGNSRNFNILDDPMATTYQNIFDYLQGRIPGLQIDGNVNALLEENGEQNKQAYSVTRRNVPTSLFVNEMEVDANYLLNVPLSEIVYLKVIDPPFIGGSGNGLGGAISIYTKKGGEGFTNNKTGMTSTRFSGYVMPKEFYSPDYASPSPLHEVEDVRSTLYWHPYLLTDKNSRKVKIQFYNNDISTSMKVVVEGINEEGRVVRIEKIIQ